MGKVVQATPIGAEVVPTPRQHVTFTACAVSSEFLVRYDAERPLAAIVQGILNQNSEQLNAAMRALTEEGASPTDLITEIRTAACGFRSLGEIFEGAAARIEAVEANPA